MWVIHLLIGWLETLAIWVAPSGIVAASMVAFAALAPRAALKYLPAFSTDLLERVEVSAAGFERSPSTCKAVTSDM